MIKRFPTIFKYYLTVANQNKYPVINSNCVLRLRKMATASEDDNVPSNQLIHSRSPYLLQHARNPVDWYPWGEQAIAKAKAEDKVIFLSVGYSTCHWCHVMEKESFENDEVAKIMNTYFINIKVDREERPDIDKIYMTYVQATTGSGGWPMSVWLTPNLTPIYGGTYYPPEDTHYNRPGFKTILMGIAKQWTDDKLKLERSGKLMIDAMMREMESSGQQISVPTSSFVYKAYHQLSNSYDSQHGGFGRAPKFPQPVNLKFLLHFYHSKIEDPEGRLALDMVIYTLRMIAQGGIHDHISYGVHRYSTDDEWHVPHFEKMLYDQAQLAEIFTEAYQITKDPLFMDMAKDILRYVSKNLRDKSGGFYSAEDADSLPTDEAKHKKEGAFCVWKKDDVMKLLNKPIDGSDSVQLYDVFCEYYTIKDDGNVNPYQDPHGELRGENVLIVKKSLENLAEQFGLDVDVVANALESGRKILREERLKRPKPHLDDKMIAAWNGLMMSAFAKAGQVFSEDTYINKAMQAATFIQSSLYDKSAKMLVRSAYRDRKGNVVLTNPLIYAFADDYAFVIQGLINLFEACGDVKWLDFALELQERQDELFWNKDDGIYYQTDGKDNTVVLRLKDDQDGAQPSSNSVSALNLLKLSEIFTDDNMKDKAIKIFKAFSVQLKTLPLSLPLMLCGLMVSESNWKRVVVKGSRNDDRTKGLVEAIHSIYTPNKITILMDSDTSQPTHKKIGVLDQLKAVSGLPTAFICEGKACSLPVTVPEKLTNFMCGKKE